jgi:perosamine synthetase
VNWGTSPNPAEQKTHELFAPGAPAPPGFVPLCVPNIGGNEWKYVKECLDAGWVSSAGAFVERFEREFAAAVGASHAVATSSGTAALHVALLVAGVRPEDEVIVPALTFVAPANAVRYVGAWPVFLDVDLDYWQLDPQRIEVFLKKDCVRSSEGLRNRHTGRRVTAILPVDILGHPCDLDAIHELAETHGLALVEDATESLGAGYRGKPLGSCGALTCFSFNGNKLLTTGGGGMVATNDATLAERIRYLSTQAKDDPLEFVHHTVGFNYRLTNVQAAVGCAQLERLDEFVTAKRRIAERYGSGIAGLEGITSMREAPWASSAYWLYTIMVDESRSRLGSRALISELESARIQARPLWQPLHKSPAHRGAFATPCPVAERVNRDALSLPSSTALGEADQTRVIDTLRDLLLDT